MVHRITIEYGIDFGRRSGEWERLMRTYVEADVNRLAPCLEVAIADAEERYGCSSDEAKFLRDLKEGLLK
ncbi:MAG: hypothetical protein JNL05_10460 [Flavobacteriales bacterium]|nr:hypothetical protein [Flavobacteriales bacterium]